MDNNLVTLLQILFLFGLVATGTSASSELQDEVHHRVLRQSITCTPYSGSACSAVLAGQPVRSENYPQAESNVTSALDIATTLAGGNLTNECEKSLLDIMCSSTYFPCAGSVWCSSNGAAELATMFNNSCVCPEPVSAECEEAKQSLIVTALLLQNIRLYQTNQVPSTLQCQTLSLAVPTGIPPTTPPLPGITCTPYSGSACSAVLAGQPVRSENYPQAESNVTSALDIATTLAGGNLTNDCEKSLLDIMCSSTYFPCAGSVWCSSNGAAELATMFNNSCVCPEPVSAECEEAKQSLIVTALLLQNIRLYQTNQVPSTLQCQTTLSLGTQGSAAPTTSQTHFYTVFTAALMILVGMMV